ncbi:LRR receptor-like serine/threonine-protein kinase FLS2 [Solanum verrucosum]|uniref:LRR receptor-like serine/threonine-protein kinase FLS2 n=1 Tax=Solanum verrucosum TaxID=315347 RepID=UPI0020D062F2|nr:LRR receptor-like serine/threonine-protein kinase FLS2 [Solanum verrucosum]
MDTSYILLFAQLSLFILLHNHTSLANISTDEASLLAFKSHISSHPNNILASNWSSSGPSNFLQGEIPRELGHLHYLSILDLQYNGLTGSIPSSIFNITTMETIALTGFTSKKNSLDGVIPPNLEKCRKLQILSLSYNEFIGIVPRELANLIALTELYLGDLYLEGEIPMELDSVPESNFQHVSTADDRFCTKQVFRLRIFELSYNSFTGPIPKSLGNLEYLENLEMNNFISDSSLSFLTSLTNCRKLRSLWFNENALDGDLSASAGNFSNSLRNFQGNGCKLQEFYLHSNEIKGTIPNVICSLKNLGALDLSGNHFSSLVSSCIGNVTSLRYLNLAYNRLNLRLPTSLGDLHDLIEFNVSSNSLSDHIPLELGNLKAVTLIDLSKNDFSGKIPSTLGGLAELINLPLAHNRLEGPIPDSFGKLLALEFLDLSYNNFSGEIPKSLEALVYLKYINFSFNKLSGEIPIGGPFANVTSQSFLSNDALCGDSRWLCGVKIEKDKENASQADVCLVKEHERISYYELEHATEGFDESNLLGTGSFSMVYQGILKDGTLLAV